MIELNDDDFLDNGAYKSCYVKNGKAYLVRYGGGSIRVDYKRHLKLKAMGFDVAKCKLTKVRLTRTNQPGKPGKKYSHVRLAMECELFGDNFIGSWVSTGTKLKYKSTAVLQRALQSLRDIFDTIESRDIIIIDQQFLVCYRTGRIVLSDPNGFKRVRTRADENYYLDNLRDILEATLWLSRTIKRRNS